MEMHDMICDELFEKKSVAAFMWLISQGRELEAAYDGQLFFITFDKSKEKVSLWINKEEKSFETIEDLVQFGEIKGKKIIDIWNEIDLETLF